MRLLSCFLSLFQRAAKAASKPINNKSQPTRSRLALESLEGRDVPASLTLGAAGNFAVLGLAKTQIQNSNVRVVGNEGVSLGGKLTNMGASTITGDVWEAKAGQYSGPGKRLGTLSIDPAFLAQADADALIASAAAAALAPTQSFGSISKAKTITGNGGWNVVSINGSISSSLTLSGSASDVFVINVTGTVKLNGKDALRLAGGVTADHVLYNFVGKSQTISTHVGNILNGTLLAPTYSFDLGGSFNGAIIGGGKSIALQAGARVNQAAFSPPPVGASLSGVVYSDENFNGQYDSTDPTLSGVLVQLFNSTGQMVAQTTTDSHGAYSFTNLAADTYTIVETQPDPYLQGTNNLGSLGGSVSGDSFIVTLGASSVGIGYNFGERVMIVA